MDARRRHGSSDLQPFKVSHCWTGLLVREGHTEGRNLRFSMARSPLHFASRLTMPGVDLGATHDVLGHNSIALTECVMRTSTRFPFPNVMEGLHRNRSKGASGKLTDTTTDANAFRPQTAQVAHVH